jgi:hypothetical protein
MRQIRAANVGALVITVAISLCIPGGRLESQAIPTRDSTPTRIPSRPRIGGVSPHVLPSWSIRHVETPIGSALVGVLPPRQTSEPRLEDLFLPSAIGSAVGYGLTALLAQAISCDSSCELDHDSRVGRGRDIASLGVILTTVGSVIGSQRAGGHIGGSIGGALIGLFVGTASGFTLAAAGGDAGFVIGFAAGQGLMTALLGR